MTRATPLLRFLRALNPDDRAEFAANAATTVVYLYQLAGQPQPNPKLRLALQLVAGSKKYAKRAMTPALTLEPAQPAR